MKLYLRSLSTHNLSEEHRFSKDDVKLYRSKCTDNCGHWALYISLLRKRKDSGWEGEVRRVCRVVEEEGLRLGGCVEGWEEGWEIWGWEGVKGWTWEGGGKEVKRISWEVLTGLEG